MEIWTKPKPQETENKKIETENENQILIPNIGCGTFIFLWCIMFLFMAFIWNLFQY